MPYSARERFQIPGIPKLGLSDMSPTIGGWTIIEIVSDNSPVGPVQARFAEVVHRRENMLGHSEHARRVASRGRNKYLPLGITEAYWCLGQLADKEMILPPEIDHVIFVGTLLKGFDSRKEEGLRYPVIRRLHGEDWGKFHLSTYTADDDFFSISRTAFGRPMAMA